MDAIFDYDEDLQAIESPIQHFDDGADINANDVSDYILDSLYIQCDGCKRLILPNVLCCDVDTFGKKENYLSDNYREWVKLLSQTSIDTLPNLQNIPKVYMAEV